MEINDGWIEEFEKKENNYNLFYLSKVNFIKLVVVTLDSNNNISQIKKDKLKLKKENVIQKEQILEIKNNSENKNNQLIGLLSYNLTICPKDIVNNNLNFDKIISHDKISDISLFDTISFFNNINCLYLIFKLKTNNKLSSKKKLNKCQSKKIIIKSSSRKTRRKTT